MDPILREWYGEGGSDGELMKYLPSSQPVGDVLQRVMQKKLPHGVADFRTVADRWTEIAVGEFGEMGDSPGVRGVDGVKKDHGVVRRNGVLWG